MFYHHVTHNYSSGSSTFRLLAWKLQEVWMSFLAMVLILNIMLFFVEPVFFATVAMTQLFGWIMQ